MAWKPADHIDEQVRGWMRARQWEVTATDYNFEQEIYSWRHQQLGGKSQRYALPDPCWNTIRHL